MLARALTVWHDLRSSLWALPLLMVVVAAAAAIAAVHIQVRPGGDPAWFLYSGDAEAAPLFLSNLLTAMITMATLVVSITMVVLTLAAQQLGPRLIRSFMADRRTQLTLGLFVATVVYLLLVLRSTYGGGDTVPNLAVTGGTVLVFLCVVALLIFVHHLARSIIADNTIDRVGKALDADLERLLPGKPVEAPPPPSPRPRETGAPLLLHKAGGYVQSIDYEGLVSVAEKADAVIELALKPGRHVISGSVIGWIDPRDAAGDELCDDVEGCFILAGEWDSLQDHETSIRQLVEVALRALSPSINDPYTAMAVVDRLSESLAKAMRRHPPRCVWTDDGDAVRLLAPVSTFEDSVEEAYRQIRQQATGQPAVLIRIVDNLGQLHGQATDAQKAVLRTQIEIALETGRRSIEQKQDLEALEERARRALGGERPANPTGHDRRNRRTK
jgi:uncharacterized membrane protein